MRAVVDEICVDETVADEAQVDETVDDEERVGVADLGHERDCGPPTTIVTKAGQTAGMRSVGERNTRDVPSNGVTAHVYMSNMAISASLRKGQGRSQR